MFTFPRGRALTQPIVRHATYRYNYPWIPIEQFLSIRTFQDPYAKKFMKDIKRTETSYIAKSGSILVSIIYMYLKKQLQKYLQTLCFGLSNLENQFGQNLFQEFTY